MKSETMKSEAWRLVFTGVSLTCVTGAALFVLVAINPKDATYGGIPWAYAAGSALLAVAFNRAAAWTARR
jgi:hypothetical protein